MTDIKHTPGPWEIGPDFDNGGTREVPIGHRLKSGFVLTVAVALGGLKGQEANARLIAAAPCLLAELQAIHDSAPACWWNLPIEQQQRIKAALAKATQEQPK